MREIRTSGLMSGEGRRGWPKARHRALPRLYEPVDRSRSSCQDPRNDRCPRILAVAGRPGEGPFTIRSADLLRGASRTTTYVPSERLRAMWVETRVTKVAKVPRSRRRDADCANQEKVRSI